MTITCPYCDKAAELVGGDVIYPHRPDLASKKFWRCAPCASWVGCHPPEQIGHNGRRMGGIGDGTVPLWRIANAELRKEKSAAHAAFDRLWKGGGMSRRQAYAWLSDALGIADDDCHIGMFDVSECRAVVRVCMEREGSSPDSSVLTTSLRTGDQIEYMGRVVRVKRVSGQFRNKSLWIDFDLVSGDPLSGSIRTFPAQLWSRVK